MNRTFASIAAVTLFTLAGSQGAHAQATGVSHPEALDDTINATASAPATDHYVKPSSAAAAPVVSTTTETVSTSTTVSSPVLHRSTTAVDPNNVCSGVVTEIHAAPNEVPEGTLLRVRLDEMLSTASARKGDHFTGHLVKPVVHDGHLLIPAGTLVRGRITEVRPSRHYLANAMMRLQPDTLTMPDGIPYPISAQLIDFDHTQDARIDTRITNEGEVVSDPHLNGRLTALGLTTAGATAAGAIVGGGVGALVGATIGVGANAIMWGKADHEQTIAAGTVLILDLDRSLMLNPNTATLTSTMGAGSLSGGGK